jgi:hypothetical protein
MKRFIAAGILFLCLSGYSQTLVKPQPYSAASLDQFMWGYSKNTPAPGEKALIDFNVIDNWRQIGHYLSINDDAKYIAYTTKKPSGTMNWWRRQDSLVIQSTRNPWRRGFVCKTHGVFTADNKQYIFQDGSDLHLLQLGNTQQELIKDITGYNLLKLTAAGFRAGVGDADPAPGQLWRIGQFCLYWISSDRFNGAYSEAGFFSVGADYAQLFTSSKSDGFSVRCVQD